MVTTRQPDLARSFRAASVSRTAPCGGEVATADVMHAILVDVQVGDVGLLAPQAVGLPSLVLGAGRRLARVGFLASLLLGLGEKAANGELMVIASGGPTRTW